MHKRRIVQPYYGNRHSIYSVCRCDYGKDHDDSRSITAQRQEVFTTGVEPSNDMLRVARREKWDFPPKELDYTISYIRTGSLNGKPVPFHEEIERYLTGK